MFDEGIIGFLIHAVLAGLLALFVFLGAFVLGINFGTSSLSWVFAVAGLVLCWILGGIELHALYSGKVCIQSILSAVLILIQVYVLSVFNCLGDEQRGIQYLGMYFRTYGTQGIKWTFFAAAFIVATFMADCLINWYGGKCLKKEEEARRQKEAEWKKQVHEEHVNQYYEDLKAQGEARARFEQEYGKTGHSSDHTYQQENASESTSGGKQQAFSYFDGCTTREQVQKRYRDLCKVYHPDMGNGSAEVFAQINREYEQLKRQVS